MKVFCLLSDKRVFRSRLPEIFTLVMQRVGMKGSYVPFMVEPDQIGRALESLRILHISGANVTVPYQETSIPHLDELSEGARIIGAVNTVVCSGPTLKGYNTNAIGFMDALTEAGFDVDGKSALVFGTGGMAKAVVFILNWLRAASVVVAGRDTEKARTIVDQFAGDVRPLHTLADVRMDVDLVVNTTSVSSPEESRDLADLVDSVHFGNCRLLMDMNYGRSRNFWRSKATAAGIPFVDGVSALANQARRTFALWTGIHVAPEEFLKALGDD